VSADGDSLERRVARLEDVEAIRQLKLTYARLCDNGYDADGIVGLFDSEGDVSWEGGAFGVHRGHEAIRTFFQNVSSEILWAVHLMLNPLVQVAADGNSAQGSWYLLELATMTAAEDAAPPDAVIMSGVYDDRFVKRQDGWRFQRIKIDFHQISNLDRGWVAQRFR
jgi:SnoaL-like domain